MDILDLEEGNVATDDPPDEQLLEGLKITVQIEHSLRRVTLDRRLIGGGSGV
jgi:hypothetical protein